TDNNVVVAGFTGAAAAANFGGGPLTAGPGKEAVVAKINSATGALVWAKQYAATKDGLAHAVPVYRTGNDHIVGQCNGPTPPVIDFGRGRLPTEQSAATRISVAKLNTSAGAGTASKSFGAGARQNARAVAADAAGNIVRGGTLTGNTLTFGTGALVAPGAA